MSGKFISNKTLDFRVPGSGDITTGSYRPEINGRIGLDLSDMGWECNGLQCIDECATDTRNEGLTATKLNFHDALNSVGMQQPIYNHQ
jgi:hypothetical protein